MKEKARINSPAKEYTYAFNNEAFCKFLNDKEDPLAPIDDLDDITDKEDNSSFNEKSPVSRNISSFIILVSCRSDDSSQGVSI